MRILFKQAAVSAFIALAATASFAQADGPAVAAFPSASDGAPDIRSMGSRAATFRQQRGLVSEQIRNDHLREPHVNWGSDVGIRLSEAYPALVHPVGSQSLSRAEVSRQAREAERMRWLSAPFTPSD